jgi:glutamate-1-semialdehyde 2,1-aminomutase
MRTVAVVQARLGSSRFPRKVLSQIGDQSSIELLLKRLSRSKKIDQIIVALADEPGVDYLSTVIANAGFDVYLGHVENVLLRVVEAGRAFDAELLVRVTGDCPFIDAEVVDEVISLFQEQDLEYASNINPPTYPDGLDVEVFRLETLERSLRETSDPYDLEHVTTYIRRSKGLRAGNVAGKDDLSRIRLTLDEAEDLKVIRDVFEKLGGRCDFTVSDIMEVWKSTPSVFAGNMLINRNEGSNMGKGQKLWRHAKAVIPGGNMLLSKRSEMFLPDNWPSYFSKAKGCEVWDLDGNHFFDMASMGVGTNILGYGNEAVDEAVLSAVKNGNMSTLNCPEEVELVDRLLALNPWAGMAKLARTGGEANSIAVRIARASTGKDKVAICGYHGWHDWYLSANLADDSNLDGHLLPGLQPNGVPRQLKGTVLPFEYNDINALRAILSGGDVAAIKMEVYRSVEPKDDFLSEVRNLATEQGVVLIFDECTSGFRETFGGLHKKYRVEPDLAVYGKALGNGYAITAVVGKTEVMQAAQDSFISSTFWTERIGPSAALASLKEMERLKSWELISSTGNRVRSAWQAVADKNQLKIKISGLPALSTFTFETEWAMEFKTYLTQQMLAKGFLASGIFYASTAHSDEVLESYFFEIGIIFEEIANLSHPSKIQSLLKGPVSHGGFKRIN